MRQEIIIRLSCQAVCLLLVAGISFGQESADYSLSSNEFGAPSVCHIKNTNPARLLGEDCLPDKSNQEILAEQHAEVTGDDHENALELYFGYDNCSPNSELVKYLANQWLQVSLAARVPDDVIDTVSPLEKESFSRAMTEKVVQLWLSGKSGSSYEPGWDALLEVTANINGLQQHIDIENIRRYLESKRADKAVLLEELETYLLVEEFEAAAEVQKEVAKLTDLLWEGEIKAVESIKAMQGRTSLLAVLQPYWRELAINLGINEIKVNALIRVQRNRYWGIRFEDDKVSRNRLFTAATAFKAEMWSCPVTLLSAVNLANELRTDSVIEKTLKKYAYVLPGITPFDFLNLFYAEDRPQLRQMYRYDFAIETVNFFELFEKDWQKLAEHLDAAPWQIMAIEQDYPHSKFEQSVAMIRFWLKGDFVPESGHVRERKWKTLLNAVSCLPGAESREGIQTLFNSDPFRRYTPMCTDPE